MTFSDDTPAWRLGFDKDEIDARQLKNKTFFMSECGLNFIDDHYGPRPGCLHVLLGSTGRGKSTLVQSLITKWGEKDKMLLYLTEESFDSIEGKLAVKGEDMSFLTPKLHLLHERTALNTIHENDYVKLLEFLKRQVEQTECKILIIDNLTTSHFYEGKIHNALPIVAGLRSIAEKYQIPVFIVAHTKKGVSEATKGLMSSDDVRGSAALSMTADYFYIFYRVRKTMDLGRVVDTAVVYVAKSRFHETQDNVYKLDYSPERMCYFIDRLINFQMFKAFMKERDKA